MADKDRDVPQDDATQAPEPVVATGDQGPDVSQDVTTNEHAGPQGADDGTAGEPDDVAPDDVAPDDVTPDDVTPADATPEPVDGTDPDVAAHLVEDEPADPDDTDGEPAWFVGEPEPAAHETVDVPQPVDPAPVVPEPVDDVEPVVDVAAAEAAGSDTGTDTGPTWSDPSPYPTPGSEPSWREDPPLAVHLGPLEPETTALTLRPPAEIFREHRRRERRRTLTFLGIFLGVLGMGAASFTFFQGRWSWPFGTQTVAAPICPTPTATGLAPADVSVQVYNAGTRKGLAKTVAGTMRKRGFLVGEVGNDPQEAKVKGAAIVRHGPDGLDAARTVAAQVDGKVEFVDDGRLSQSVDLVLGTKWTKFRSVAAANKALAPPAPSAPAGCVPASTDDTATSTDTGTTSPTPSAT